MNTGVVRIKAEEKVVEAKSVVTTGNVDEQIPPVSAPIPISPVPVVLPKPVTAPSAVKLLTRQPGDKVEYLSILDHGDSGSGKTQFCGTMIQAGLKVLYIVFNEAELQTLDGLGIHGYDYIIVTNYETQLWPIYLSLRQNRNKYEGLVIDGLGDFQQLAKDYELADGQSSGFMEKAMKGHVRMYLQNWGNLLEMTRHWISPVLKLPMHKIVTCISEPDDDPKTGRPKLYPGLQGGMKQIISVPFSVIGYSYVAFWGADTYFCMTTQPHESIATKDRTRMCRVFINPQFKTFLDTLNGKKSKPSEMELKLQRALVVKPQTSHIEVKKEDK